MTPPEPAQPSAGERPFDPSLRDEVRALVHLSWPIAIAELAFMLMGLVDTAVLGRVSPVDLAGASLGRTILFTGTMLAVGLTMGLEPVASQAVGAGENARAFAAFIAASKATALAWAPVMVACFVVLSLLERMGIPPDVAARARVAAAAHAPGFLFVLIYLAAKTFLQAHGRTRPLLLAAPVANVLNLVVCNLLARGDDALAAVGLPTMGLPALGALGAGIAFSLSQLAMAAIVVSVALTYRPQVPAPPVPASMIFRLGTPVGLQLLAEAGVFCVATVLVGRFGADMESAHQIALSLASFTFMGALGVSGATAVRVGYAVGQGRSARRAGIIGVLTGAVYMLGCATIFAVGRFAIVGLFTNEPAVAGPAAHLLVIAAVFQLFDGVQVVGSGALRGAGDVRFPFLAVVSAHWLVGLPLALLFGFALGWGTSGIWWGLAFGLAAAALLLVTRFLRVSRHVLARV